MTPNVVSWIKMQMQVIPLDYKRQSPPAVTFPGCGQKIFSETFDLDPPKHPWMVLVCSQYQQDQADSSGKKIKCGQTCGGTLISSQHIITAASCLAQADINNTVVFLEVTSVQNALMSLDYLFLSEIHPYPGQTQGETVAIIKLEKEVNFGFTLNWICLTEPFASYQDGDTALITGWQEFGQINAETTDASAVTVTMKSEEYCSEQLKNVFIKK